MIEGELISRDMFPDVPIGMGLRKDNGKPTVGYALMDPSSGQIFICEFEDAANHVTTKHGITTFPTREIVPQTYRRFTGYCGIDGVGIWEGCQVEVAEGRAAGHTGEVAYGPHVASGQKDSYSCGFYIIWDNEAKLRPEFLFWAKKVTVSEQAFVSLP